MTKPCKASPAAAAAGILLVSLISARGAFVQLPPNTAETPGLSLSATTGLTGTVIADNTVDFSFALNPYNDGVVLFFKHRNIFVPDDFPIIQRYILHGAFAGSGEFAFPPFQIQGTLRSLVVDNGGLRDYYYQLQSTAPGSDPSGDLDIFRLTIGGFTANEILSVSYRTDGLAGLSGAGTWVTGTQAPHTADRDFGGTGVVGIDFPAQPPVPFTGNSDDVNPGEISAFIVVRTNRTTDIPLGNVTIFSSGIVVVPAPEPTVSLLLGAGCLAASSCHRRRCRRGG